jgi:hypothetical protein
MTRRCSASSSSRRERTRYHHEQQQDITDPCRAVCAGVVVDMALDRVGGPAIRRLELVFRRRGSSGRIVVEEFFAGFVNETQ